MESKGKTWSRGTNSRLPFAVNLNLNLSINIIPTYSSFLPVVSCKLTNGRVGVLALCKRLHCFSCAVLYESVGKLERYYGNPG